MLQEPATPAADYTELFKLLFPLLSLILNLLVAGYFFYYKNKREDKEIERKIKMDWFKTLILDNNLTYFHEFFENVEQEIRKILSNGDDDQLKIRINEAIKDYNKKFRVRFIDSLLAVDISIYDNLIKISDDMIDGFTNNIFDPGINLSHLPKFEEIVVNQLSQTKTRMIQELFKFNGLPAKSETLQLPPA